MRVTTVESVDGLSTMHVARNPERRGWYVDVRQLPTQWVKLAEARGIAGSANALALRAGIATTTLTRLVFGQSTSPDTIRKVSIALGVDQERVRELAGIPTPLGVWNPPEQANGLDQMTRDALDMLILAIARREGGSNADAKPEEKMPGLGTAGAIGLDLQPEPGSAPQSGLDQQSTGPSR